MRVKFIALFFVLLCVPAWAQNSISVRVTDGQKPLAGATVALRIWGEKPYREETLHTGDDGAVTFQLAQPLDPKKPVGSVTAYAQGFALQSHAIDAATLELALPPGTIWRGTVVDEAGAPLAGATINVNAMRAQGADADDYNAFIFPVGEQMQAAYSAKTGADGAFEIAGLPVGGTFSYGTSAAKFAATNGQDVTPEQKTRIVLKPGALLSGQLLGLDGKPLPNFHVFASNADRLAGPGGGDAQTDAEGKFVIDGLNAGAYNVSADSPEDAAYVVPTQQNVLAKVGQTNAVPTLQAVAGLIVKGIVRDAATRTPLAGAQIAGIFGPDGGGSTRNQGQLTGADGRFSVRVLPGQNTFQFYQTPEFYISSGIQQTLDVDAKTPELVFDLPRQPIVTGTIIDEKNQPIAAQLKIWGGFQGSIKSDAQGKWSYQPESLEPVQLAGGDAENGYYEILAGNDLQVTSKEPQTIKVRLRFWQKLRGRVVAPDGTPRVGVAVKADFYYSAGTTGGLLDSALAAKTGADGTYQFDKIRGGEKTGEMANGLKVTVKAEGLSFAGGGEISADGANWQASDIVLSALDRQIEGTTAAGARVVAAGKSAVADANGHFSFKDLPAGEITVYAALNGNFGSATAAGAAPVSIELAPMKAQGTDVELGRDAWREVYRESEGKDFYARDWVLAQLNAVQGETFESLQASAGEPPTPNHDWSLASQLTKWAPKLGAGNRVAQIESVARGIQEPETRASAWLDAALAVPGDTELNARALREADALLARAATDMGSRESNLYRVAVVTERVEGEKAGAAALDKAIALTLKTRGAKTVQNAGYVESGRDGFLAMYAEVVAQGSPELLRRLVNNIAPEAGDRVAALANAVPVVARARGVEAALPLLEELRAMPQPERTPGEFRSSQNEPQYAFDTTARRIAPLLAATSPARALELARRISDNGGRARALASVAAWQAPDMAAGLWREAVTIGDSGDTPRFAAQAFDKDAKLGRELFELARSRGANGESYSRGGFWAPYAFYLARADAGAARLELEREWSARLANNEGQSLSPIAMAMSAADGSRALEMARQIPAGKDNFWSLEARRKIAQYLVADENQRRDWPFDRWGATDTWEPGEQEW